MIPCGQTLIHTRNFSAKRYDTNIWELELSGSVRVNDVVALYFMFYFSVFSV